MSHNYDRKPVTISKSKPTQKKAQSDSIDIEAVVNVPKSIGKLIEKKRIEKEMTQKELQTKANIPAKVMSDWEVGKGVWNMKVAEKIGKVLGIDVKIFKDLLSKEKTSS